MHMKKCIRINKLKFPHIRESKSKIVGKTSKTKTDFDKP